jgi:hypothetical protein
MPRKKKLEVDFTDEDSVLAEMAGALDIDPDELKIKDDRSGFSVQAYEVTTRGGRKEWRVVENEDAERELALEIVKQDLDDQPEMFEQSFIESHINIDRLRRDLESDVQYGNEERLRDERPDDFWKEYEREGFDAPEEDEDGNRRDPEDSEIEELASSQTESELEDPMQYLEDIYGKEDAVKKAIEIAGFDIDAAAEEAVDTDGASHFLSSYDGNSYTTDGGLVYWRVN